MKMTKYRLVFGFMVAPFVGVKVVQFCMTVELFPDKLIISLLQSTIDSVHLASSIRISLKRVS